jgi:hypothetical protein
MGKTPATSFTSIRRHWRLSRFKERLYSSISWTLQLPGFEQGAAEVVNVSTGDNPWHTERIAANNVHVSSYTIVMLTGV